MLHEQQQTFPMRRILENEPSPHEYANTMLEPAQMVTAPTSR
jgi:hypothetical protein